MDALVLGESFNIVFVSFSMWESRNDDVDEVISRGIWFPASETMAI
jgi:hypothetical protein